MNISSSDIQRRLTDYSAQWRVSIEETCQTETSLIAFGARDDTSVAIKIVRNHGDEWRTGEVIAAFDGNGMVRVLDYVDGAALLERITPATQLVDLSLHGDDDAATEIIADVIRRMSSTGSPPTWIPTAEAWGKAFDNYRKSGDDQLPADLIERAERLYFDLCTSQTGVRLLHGDLQHYNILLDSIRGWLAVDPKGVIGETEFELGASLRNPGERTAELISAERIARRIAIYESILEINPRRTLEWAYAQGVLSLIWGIEDGYTITAASPSMMLVKAVEPRLGSEL